MTVVVVGAGVAGLACAAELIRRGCEVRVLEATGRYGGRVHSHPSTDGHVWELGAQVIHGVDNPLWSALPAGLERESFRQASFSALLGGRQRPLAAVAGLGMAPWAANQAVADIGNVALDRTVEQWLDGSGLPGISKQIVGRWMAQEWAAEPAEIACAELADTVAARPLTSAEAVLRQGYGALPDQLASGVQVELDTPVRSIRPRRGGASVTTDAGEFAAEGVVVTVPPWTIGGAGLHIEGLPGDRRLALSQLRGGDALVAVIEFDRACGQDTSVFDADTGYGFLRARAGARDVQIVCKGAAVQRFRALLGRPGQLRSWLSAAMPWTAGAPIVGIRSADWGAHRYIAGAFTIPSRGSAAARAAYAEPWSGSIFFAGESTCDAQGVARVHGAYTSGRRAAAELLDGSLPC